MNSTFTSRLSALPKALLGLAALGLSVSAAQAQTVYGLSTSGATSVVSLVTFDAATPGTFTATVPITGLGTGQTLVGLDSRPNTGELFALGYNPTGTQAQLYTINRLTGAATTVGAALTLNLGTTTSRIGFDFNPTVDRIRVTGSNLTNFRLNPNNGALAATDGNLAYAATDANAAQTPGIGSVAYGNSYIGATTTVLYDIDETNSRYTTQSPPNDGILNSREQLTVSTAAALATDLDIYFNPTTSTNNAYLTIATGTAAAPSTQLYTLNFLTGASLTAVGNVGPAGTLVTDIAFAINRPVTLPVLTGQLAYALAGTNLLSFDTSAPGTIRTSVGITGVDAAQTVVGMDIRPLNNALYILGYNATAQTGQLYALNATTGAATSISGPLAMTLGTGDISFDFNPTVDRIRVVGANRNNYRLNPVTGTVAATDGQVAYTTGTNTPTIGAVAYTNSFMGADATSGTMLYNYDQALNVLNTQSTANPPADGQLTTVGASGITVNTTAPNVDMDIYSTGAGMNMAYLVANVGTSLNSGFYTLNLATGAATLVGTIGNGSTVRDIAIAGPAGVVTGTRPAAEVATGLSLFPNPVTREATVAFTLPRSGQVTLRITDALGRTVEEAQPGQLGAGAQTLRWNSASRKAGMYFLSLQLDGQPAGTQRVVVQ
ncbi:DUF4394 domain-containing protein [Hymenobacter taeanensis]|uniref:DUF4394 domain-containing protein n=1 Tax=Hymenobacter taeanensis TaxID=2735321 RepID=A0A6M6BC02_9BACT|nr:MULTISPECIES: DUF4394 domain-containing protein [Hymenobacter]QJX45736.1 DUF4394 domain-containing protein [Hymenobacter taeanensis]UOQ79576.1 DUF4394 domain-containing protein [Hymenobacter sp. 5414T-23]